MKTLVCLSLLLIPAGSAVAATVTTLIGTGVAGFADNQVGNPYGMTIGPDGGLYFCDLDNQRVRRLDLATKRVTTIAGQREERLYRRRRPCRGRHAERSA